MLDRLLTMLDETDDLPAPVYRTAVRLARRTEPGASYVRVSYEEMADIVGTDSDNTVRGHLAGLTKAGLCTYQRNHSIHVWWKLIAERAPRAPGDHHARQAITETPEADESVIAQRAPRAPGDQQGDDDDESVIAQRAPRAPGDQPSAEDEKIDRTAITTRDQRAPRAPGDQYLKVGREVGRKDLLPTYLPGGSGGDDGLTPEQTRSVALLTDPDFGMDSSTAAALAKQYTFDAVRAHAFGVLDDVQSGKIRSVYVLAARLKRGGAPQITAADRLTGLWQRHCPEEEAPDLAGMTPEERRRRYMPDELAGVIIG